MEGKKGILNIQKKKSETSNSKPKLNHFNSSYLRSTIVMNGEISGEDDLIIEGKVKGKINLKQNNLIIEKNATVEAEIYVHSITIRGKVKGNIYASGRISIQKEGRLVGDISAFRISIMEGAQFKGNIKMTSSPK